jgi:hypothetical protein
LLEEKGYTVMAFCGIGDYKGQRVFPKPDPTKKPPPNR